MRIAEAADKSGLSIDTIRFYEKSGLVPALVRGADGHRRFSETDIEWLTLLAVLRQTGMPMATLRRFAALYRQGDETIAERRQVLLDHGTHLQRQRAGLDRCEAMLAKKLAIYRDILGD